jgi:hypothetical protein
MGHDDLLNASEIDREVPAVAHEGCALGAGVEEKDMFGGAEARPELQAIAEIGNEQGLTADFAGAGQHDVSEFQYGKAGLLAYVSLTLSEMTSTVSESMAASEDLGIWFTTHAN